MDCKDFRLELDDWLDGRSADARARELRSHSEGCAACRGRLDAERALRQALRSLAAPAPSAGFEARVFAGIRRAAPRRAVPRFAYALAASLALSVGLAAWLAQMGDVSPMQRVELAAQEVKPVRLVFRSPRALENVTVQLALPDGVELAGRPGRSELSWQTDLQAGANVLELPVVVQRGEGGVLTANLSLGQDRKQFAVLVLARRPAVLFLERPAAVNAAAGRSDFSPGKEVVIHA